MRVDCTRRVGHGGMAKIANGFLQITIAHCPEVENFVLFFPPFLHGLSKGLEDHKVCCQITFAFPASHLS